ncbi:MFS transporter [Microlunatus antarcticus]|uniref:MFS family permease n=1 Tax=Microlunatus antarcticus TaxID=53388 RepID=A0A7W5JU27_9ACTN|nr:MFS transporter [Microlunatus antarcticus]MBB3325787.1 MFS family permease [Microlunatus antarcticus]
MSTAAPTAPAGPGWRHEITRAQWMVLAATTLGWALDGLDSSLFTLVVGQTTGELLPGLAPASLSFWTGLAVTIYLTGWALGAVVFGALADYIGRVRVLMIGVLAYSVFTGLAAFAPNYGSFVTLRFLAGLGSGVELPIGAALVAEAWNNRFRAKATGVMMSGLAIGFFLATLVYRFVGPYGWRPVLLVGVLPALLVLFVRRHVEEPESMAVVRERRAERKLARAAGAERTTADRFVLVQLFTRPLLRRTVLCTLIAAGALFAFWSVTTWTPAVIRGVVAKDGITGTAAVPYVSNAMAMLYLGGVLGYAAWGFIADAIGRKRAYAVSLVLAILGVGLLYPLADSYTAYLIGLPVVGFGVYSLFSGNSVYFPELFGPAVRASAIAVTNSIGRLATAAGPLLAGIIAAQWFGGSLALAIASVSGLVVLAIIGLAMLPETHGSMALADDQLVTTDDTARVTADVPLRPKVG